jgi:hypothetical protein
VDDIANFGVNFNHSRLDRGVDLCFFSVGSVGGCGHDRASRVLALEGSEGRLGVLLAHLSSGAHDQLVGALSGAKRRPSICLALTEPVLNDPLFLQVFHYRCVLDHALVCQLDVPTQLLVALDDLLQLVGVL